MKPSILVLMLTVALAVSARAENAPAEVTPAETGPEPETTSEASPAPTETGYAVKKVNHEYLNEQGESHEDIANFPSKARYQGRLKEAGKFKGVRFHVHWRAPSSGIPNFVVKLEAHGLDAGSGRETVETLTKAYDQTPGISAWETLEIKDETLKRFGKLMAWKVTLLQNGQPVASRKSFMWDDSIPATAKATATP